MGTICFLPWVITWFGHVIDSYETVVRLFDIFIGSHEFTPIYMSAAIVLYRAEDIFQTPCDMPLIHQMLSHVSDEKLIFQFNHNFQSVISHIDS